MNLSNALKLLLALACIMQGAACARANAKGAVVPKAQPVALEDEQLEQSSMTVDEFSAAILQDMPLAELKAKLGVPFPTAEQDMYFLKDGKAIVSKHSISVQRSGEEDELVLRRLGKPTAAEY